MSFNQKTIQSLAAERQRSGLAQRIAAEVRALDPNARGRSVAAHDLLGRRYPKTEFGLSGLGTTLFDESSYARPTVDYVRAGDVIRVNVVWTRATDWFVFDVTPIYTAFRNALGGAFNVVAMSPAEHWTPGGTIAVEVQTRGDFNRLADVVSIVASNAQSAGLSVDVARTRGEFVSKVETTGGTPTPTIRDPREQSGSGFESFFNSLTSSPVTLAVILGAAVVLVIAAKR